jgi:serine/threonine-protein kinase
MDVSQEVADGRYRLLRELGRGGMATVYLAVDEKHHRQVALKVLRPDLAARVGPERFLREIEITASLNHPHILPLLDSGAENGTLYYVMPYVPGGSLRLLVRTGPIPLDVATRIATQVAAALDHAHVRGVVHRDVKPENILFNEGLAVVSDFGIARAVGGAEKSRMTGTGLSVGTLGYMSPEQALGAEEPGPATDVYGLGCVVYEMLVGETPVSWPGPEDVELGRLSELPGSHRERLERHPGRVEQVLARALALRAEHRYPTSGEMAAALASAAEPTRRLGEAEVRRLLDRAAELQAREEEPVGRALTMGAVEQIAAEVGIPPIHVRGAAR